MLRDLGTGTEVADRQRAETGCLKPQTDPWVQSWYLLLWTPLDPSEFKIYF